MRAFAPPADQRGGGRPRGVPLRHASEQNFTLAQSRSHFLRHANGRWHVGQVLVGSSDLRIGTG